MNNPERPCMPDYEAMYRKATEKLMKAQIENEQLRKELEQKKKSLLWYDGIKQACEVIFGKEFYPFVLDR